jgi:hypothetical protein
MGLAYVIALFSFEAKNLKHCWKRMRKGHATIDTYEMTEPAARLDSDRDMQLREAQQPNAPIAEATSVSTVRQGAEEIGTRAEEATGNHQTC